MTVRRYRSDDRAQLLDLWAEAFPNPAPHNTPARMLDAKLAHDDLILVAESGNALIGAAMLGYDGHRGWLYAVAVRESDRRTGVARSLVEAATTTLRGMGCSKLNLQVRADNADVVAFYEALGFAQEPRISLGKLM